MSPELTKALEQTRELFRTRDRAEDWGRNILEGSKGLTTEGDWTKYYSYLTNPGAFNPDVDLETLDPNEVIEDIPAEFEEVTHMNGTEVLIEYKRRTDDEKSGEAPRARHGRTK